MKMDYKKVNLGLKNVNISKDEKIEMNKRLTREYSLARAEAKGSHCLSCGKECTSFCNSHSIPRFCLTSICEEGFVSGINSILKQDAGGMPIFKEKLGVNQAGVFNTICNECDNTLFSEYESPEIYKQNEKPSQKIMAEIATKNYLKVLGKRQIEQSLTVNNLLHNMDPNKIPLEMLSREFSTIFASSIDLREYNNGLKQSMKNINKYYLNPYYQVFYEVLDYVVPIAIQYPVTLYIDLEGEVVNDGFGDPSYKTTEMHLCVFPLKNSSVVLLFVNNHDNRYKQFIHQFNRLSKEEKLGVINYIIFLYTEDFFMSPKFIEMNDLSVVYDIVNEFPVLQGKEIEHGAASLSERYTLARWNVIPNYLSEEYKIR